MSRSTPAGETASKACIIFRCARTRSSRSADTASGAAAPNMSAIAVAVARASSRIPSYSSGHRVMQATLSRLAARFSWLGGSRDARHQHPGAAEQIGVDTDVDEPGVGGELVRAFGLV